MFTAQNRAGRPSPKTSWPLASTWTKPEAPATFSFHQDYSSLPPRNRIDQTRAQADAKSASCMACHKGIEDMHGNPNVVLGCADCHGGDASAALEKKYPGFLHDQTQYEAFKMASHVQPLNNVFW